ncbi:hypothetical protein [Rhodobacter ferrooxidans]|uniref:Uncharacterized protein n=1 Tax=Rhodobacter ferrooxidans TaxID=371731 RepID=C8S450_9RHOB|nr:hypothetical protein [Rhodobacter sp. SW2]EEW24216.1 conserved hypothetical protein [Rhodobacter sp. SW2]
MAQRRAGLRYLGAALALGLIALWGSENLFWTVPLDGIAPLDWLLTWGAYSLVAAVALSAVLWSGLSGWRAAFLGGAVLGFGLEGVVATTMYDAFPFQLVWTPLAWHALVTGLMVLALPRRLARGGVWRQVVGLLGLGLFGAVWGWFWPTERSDLPGFGLPLVYLPGMAVSVVLAQLGLDRLGRLEVPRPWVLLLAPGVLAALWLGRLAAMPSPLLLACPALIGVTVWAARRLGPGPVGLELGPAVPVWRHGLFLLAPLVTALLVVPGWGMFGPVPSNILVAVGAGGAALVLWLRLVIGALRRR